MEIKLNLILDITWLLTLEEEPTYIDSRLLVEWIVRACIERVVILTWVVICGVWLPQEATILRLLFLCIHLLKLRWFQRSLIAWQGCAKVAPLCLAIIVSEAAFIDSHLGLGATALLQFNLVCRRCWNDHLIAFCQRLMVVQRLHRWFVWLEVSLRELLLNFLVLLLLHLLLHVGGLHFASIGLEIKWIFFNLLLILSLTFMIDLWFIFAINNWLVRI